MPLETPNRWAKGEHFHFGFLGTFMSALFMSALTTGRASNFELSRNISRRTKPLHSPLRHPLQQELP